MTALFIVIAVLILVALLRIGLNIEYGNEGFIVKVKVGPFLLRVIPKKRKKPRPARRSKDKPEKKRKKKKRAGAERKEKDKDKETKQKKPGGLAELEQMLPMIKKALGRFRRRFLIKRLTVIFTAAGSDASATAAMYGYANVAIGMLDPILDNAFRIRRRDFRTYVDFIAQKPTVYIKAVVSLALWEAVYIIFTLLPLILSAASAGDVKQSSNKHGESSKSNSYVSGSIETNTNNSNNNDNSDNKNTASSVTRKEHNENG